MANERKRVFIIVKTTPTPSEKYRETVCTAGVTEDGTFIRLYPFSYRYFSDEEKFKRYQWISIDVEKSSKDPRPESYKAHKDTLKVEESVKDWSQRKKLIFKNPVYDMCDLKDVKRTDFSLAIVKPRDVEFKVHRGKKEWGEKQKTILRQNYLFDNERKELKKVPYTFAYKYRCDNPSCKGHVQIIHDWEITAAYWRFLKQYENESLALEKLKNLFNDRFCSKEIDLHFFVGRHALHNSWLLIGLWYPPNIFPDEQHGQDMLWKFLK